ncbi:MAG: HEAT repeat domain-containing protein [Planctomycetes bacterium]|nr:HEAT repeat domain-containing protein [Planctomycetota bacterium]
MDDDVEHYLRELHSGDEDEAFHRLIEAGPRILPRLEAEFDRETDPATRAALIEVIWQLRVPECLPVLGKALRDAAPPVWKQALDGLVTLACPEAIAILDEALAATEARGPEAREFLEWVAEALEQARVTPDTPG